MATPDFEPTVSKSRGSSAYSQSGGTQYSFWRPSKLLAKDVMTMARSQFKQPLEYYPGATQTPTDPYLSQGIEGLYSRAAMGSPITGVAENLGAATLRGDYLAGNNPYLDQYFSRAARGITSEYMNAVRPDLESRFAGAGRTGGGSYQSALGRAQQGLGESLGELGSQVYMGAYEAERGRQQQALAMAPMLQGLGYTDYNEMMRAGAARQSEAQRLLDDDVARWKFEQMEPWQRIGLAQGAYGQAPVVSGSEFWQEGTSSQQGKDVTVAPYYPESGGGGGGSPMWLQMLMSLI